jgi:phosphoglycerate dehydrogenase-like enzyme
MFEMRTLSLGIIGLGRIGGCLSDKGRHLFRRVMAVDPYIQDEEFIRHGAEKTDLDTLLKESHVISLHCNLNPETRNIIDMDAF